MTLDAAAATSRFPPGPPPRTGLVRSMDYYIRISADPIGFVADRFRRYGDLYFAPNAAGGLYVLRHPDHIREVLVTRAASFSKGHSALQQLRRVLGEGLLTSDGDAWKRHRRMIQPAFSLARLAGYAGVMTEEAVRTAAEWRDGEVREIGGEMMQLTLRVVCRTLFGHAVDRATMQSVAEAMVTLQEGAARPDFLPKWAPSPARRRLRSAVGTLDRIMYRMIDDRRRAGPAEGDGPPDLLGTLVNAVDEEGDGGRLTEREVRDELVTLFLAGHETTSQALTWTLYLLSQHPRAEETLHAELEKALGGAAPTYDDLPRMPYTEQVLNEAMRLYPPFYTMGRMAVEDTEIGGYPVRTGAEVMLWIYQTHHDARWFPEPEAFRPERFAPEEAAKLPKLAHVPFGAGARACIGKVFAMLEGRLLLATLAQRWRLSLVEGHRVVPKPRITLIPKYGMPMTLRRR
jgi:cytochrome P450